MKKGQSLKLLVMVLISVVSISLLSGCALTDHLTKLFKPDGGSDVTIAEAEHGIYCIRTADVGLVKVACEIDTSSPEALIESCIQGMKKNLNDTSYRNVLTGNVDIVNYSYDASERIVTLYFNDEYDKLPPSTEILVRAAVVKTLTQFSDKIQYVSIGVGSKMIMGKDEQPLLMQGKDFVSNISGNMDYVREDYVTLYFLSEDGKWLQPEEVVVKYLSKINLETAIVNSLIAGPINEGVKPILSPDVVVNKVYVKEGICYVDLNEKFFERINGQSFELNIYSIVNSLTQFAGINRVQFLIDGDIFTELVDGHRIDTLFERDMSLVKRKGMNPDGQAPDETKHENIVNKDIEQQVMENQTVKDTKSETKPKNK